MSSEWETIALGEVAQVRSGYAFKSSAWTTEGIPVVKISNVKSGRLEMEKCSHVPEELAKEAGDFNLNTGDILIAMTGYIGDVARVQETDLPVVLNQRVGKFVVKDTPRLDEDYLFQFLSWAETRRTIESLGYGSAQPNVSPSLIHSVEMTLPPIEEQRSIASILGALDDKIELNRRMNATLEAMAQALFKEWFLTKAKEEWPLAALEEHYEVGRGLSYTSKGLSDGEGMPMHNLNTVEEGGGYKYRGIKWYTGEYKERHLVVPGDLVATSVEQGFEYLLIGYGALIPKRFGECGLFSQDLCRLRPLATSHLSAIFLYFLLQTPTFHDLVVGYSNGTTVNHLAIDGFRKPEFRVPDRALHDTFIHQVKPMLERMELNHEENVSLSALRDTLLPKLMRGEVRVKDAQTRH